MADGFKFPDEEQNAAPPQEIAEGGEVELQVEIVDDTPPQDRGREPLPKEIVKELEEDDLDEYSDKVKKRLSQMKKVWHDERREKERALREREEALRYAEIQKQQANALRKKLGDGEKLYKDEATKFATNDISVAKERLRQAYEAGDPDKITDAQEALTDAKLKLKELEYFKPSLQEEGKDVETDQQARAPTSVVDQKAEAWRQRNTWFGADEEMTALALGLHEKLVRSGVDPRSDEYYRRVDETMKKRFPEAFEDAEEEVADTKEEPKEEPKATPRKSATVVAPASRSTAPKKVRLTQTQLALAKKFGLTPEAYAKELIKLGNYNG